MLDPATIAAAVSVSTAAFNNLKKAFAMGRDIEQMGGDLSRWMKASSDIDNAVKSCKNPPFYKKMLSGDSVEEAAMKSLVATIADHFLCCYACLRGAGLGIDTGPIRWVHCEAKSNLQVVICETLSVTPSISSVMPMS